MIATAAGSSPGTGALRVEVFGVVTTPAVAAVVEAVDAGVVDDRDDVEDVGDPTAVSTGDTAERGELTGVDVAC